MMQALSSAQLYKLFIDCQQKITTDTRKIESGCIYFALKGENFDGNNFAQKAIESGCLYAIVDNENLANGTNVLFVENVLESLQSLAKFHRKKLKYPIIGITGSNGKTTHKELIHAVLSKKYNTYATKGNLNNHIGVPLTVLSLTDQHQMAIIEMGANHQGEIALLSNICDPDFGLITNIGKAHLEGFGGVEGIKRGKSELYKHIKHKNGKIFINADDSVLMELSEELDKITYGEKDEYDVYGKLGKTTEYVSLQWNIKKQPISNQKIVKTQMFGYYNFINILCAICVGKYFEVPESAINEALENYTPEMNRSQVKKTEKNTLILDAYNANPSSMELAINNFINQPLKNKVFIIGDMFELGEYSKQEHEKVLHQLKDYTNCMFIGSKFFEFKNQYQNQQFFENTEASINYISAHPIKNSTILIKGSRSMKLEKLVDFL